MLTERVDLRTGGSYRAGKRKLIPGAGSISCLEHRRRKGLPSFSLRLSFEGLKDKVVFLFGHISLSRAPSCIDAGRPSLAGRVERKEV